MVRIAKLPGMAIIFTDPSHGYLLTDRVIGEDSNFLRLADEKQPQIQVKSK